MKKFLLLALAIGALIPICAQIREFYYLSALFVFALLLFAINKKPVSLINLLVLFLITIPLHTFRLGGIEHFIRLSEIAFIPLFLVWIMSRFLNKSKEPFTIRKEFLLLGIYLLINIASTRNSIYPAISIEKTLILAYLFLFTYIVSDIINKKERLTTVVKAMIWISSISAIIAAAQSVFPQLLIFKRVSIGTAFGISFYRTGVGWHDPNYYALYLALNAIITLSLLLSRHGKKYRFLKICFLLQLIGVLSTFSRTVMGSLALASLYPLIYFGRKKTVLAILLFIIITMGIMASSASIIYKKYPLISSIVYRIPDQETLSKQPTLIMGHRYAAFMSNWSMFLDHPILGVGPFMAMYNFDKYKPFGYKYPYPILASHNQYLQLLAEKGIFGFVVFLAFISIIIKNINISIRNLPDSEYKAYLVGFKSAILVYLIASLALETSHELQFWLTAGLSMAFFNIMKKEYKNA